MMNFELKMNSSIQTGKTPWPTKSTREILAFIFQFSLKLCLESFNSINNVNV